MGSEQREKGIGGFLREVRRSMAVDAAKKGAWWVLGLVACGLALLVLEGGSVPAWTLLVAILVCAAAGAGLVHHRGRALAADVEALAEQRDSIAAEADAMALALERHESYSRHVAQALDALQRVVSGDITVSMDRYIEQALLEPARDLLVIKPAEDVRLSVLLPRPDQGGERWFMPWAAGHSLTGKAKYDERIVDTLARHAYESGVPQHWPDVVTDSGFRANPKASQATRTLLSLPVRSGDAVLGVFNVISSEAAAFGLAEQNYIASLGGVLSVAVGVQFDANGRG